jgi:hypothetical protein
MFYRCLKRFDIEQVEQAFKAHLNDPDVGKFQPKPADIIAKIEGTRQDRTDRASLAWQHMMRNLDTYQTVVFDDPAIHYAIRIAFGDWIKVGQITEQEMPFRRKDFIDAYAAYNPGAPYPGMLIGILERDNNAAGYVYHAPYRKLVGDVDRCRAVLDNGRDISGMGKLEVNGIMEV